MDRIRVNWQDSVVYSECTWHQLSPYIGKMKSSMARSLIQQFSRPGDTIYDPFCGSGTVALEAWIADRHVIAGDLSPYACALSRGKVCPPRDVGGAMKRLAGFWALATDVKKAVDLRKYPPWVRRFFHRETLRETIALSSVLLNHRQWFLLSCLLGILHHWRPAFLSYPACHTTPYLMEKRYPRETCPEKYRYRDVLALLHAKIARAFARPPQHVDRRVRRNVTLADAASSARSASGGKISAIITSPPYMNSLSYARDNRLRLWFLGVTDHRALEPRISPSRSRFLTDMRSLLPLWARLLPAEGPCVLVLGAMRRGTRYHDLPAAIIAIVKDASCGLEVTGICRNVIPPCRRAGTNGRSVREDTILVLRNRR